MEDCVTPIRDEADGLLKRNAIVTADVANEKNLAGHSPIRDYIQHEDPDQIIDEAVNKFNIPQPEIQISAIKVNNDIPPIAADSTVDISDLPIKDDVKNAEEKNIIGEAYREADDTLKSNDNDIPHAGAAKKYFLEKIGQYKSLYDEGDTNSAVDRKLSALGECFQDNSSTGSK